jgi:hypothetical protein
MEDSGERSAQEYLAKHKILELFENLTAALVFERPGMLYSNTFFVVFPQNTSLMHNNYKFISSI